MQHAHTGLLVVLLAGCGPGEPDEVAAQDLRVSLRWVRGHPDQGWDRARQGLWWTLGSLGALPPADEGAVEVSHASEDEVFFTLDLGEVGLPEASLEAMARALEPVLSSDEHQRIGSVDMGRLLMRTAYEPWHYYAITGACLDLDTWRAHRQPDPLQRLELEVSALTFEARTILLPEAQASFPDLAYEAQEPEEREVLDLMDNGRQRFAVYNAEGWLQAASDPELSPAGPPGRCMWCHEGRLMQTFTDSGVGEDSISLEDFLASIEAQQATLDAWRATLDTAMDLDGEAQVHVWGEVEVETFLHPTAERIALEWGLSAERVTELMGTPEAEPHTEHGDLGPTWTRAQVDGVFEDQVAYISGQSTGVLAGLSLQGYAALPVLPDSRQLDPFDPKIDGSSALVEECAP